MLATIDVIGATVVITWSFPPAKGPLASAPADIAVAGHENFATFASAMALESLDDEDVVLPQA
jgi:hypothetical protein